MRLLFPLGLLGLLLAACGSSNASAPTPAPTTNTVANVATVPMTTPPPVKGGKHRHSTSGPTMKTLPTTPPVLAATPTPIPASAYTATIVGTVRDAGTKSPLAGALVVAADGSHKTRTNAFGQYTLRFPGGAMATVQVTMNGYAGQLSIGKVAPHGRLRLNFSLTQSSPSHPAAPPAPSLFGTPSAPAPKSP